MKRKNQNGARAVTFDIHIYEYLSNLSNQSHFPNMY